MIREIIFDFDGTLALTFEISIKILNSLVNDLGYRKITKKDVLFFRKNGLKNSLQKIGFPMWKLPKTALKIQKKLNERMDEVESVIGMKDILEKLKMMDISMGILTSNTEENVRKFLVKNNLDVFEYIHSEKNIFGKDKIIKKILNERNLNKNEVIYVGDEIRDWEACKKVEIRMIGVSWGFSDRKLLQESGLKEIVDRPSEIIDLV